MSDITKEDRLQKLVKENELLRKKNERLQTKINGFLREFDNLDYICSGYGPTNGLPDVAGFDVYGGTMPFKNGTISGDRLFAFNYKDVFDMDHLLGQAVLNGATSVVDELQMTRDKAGVLLIDVSGHQMTDAALAKQLERAILVGAWYELEEFGAVTNHLFEVVNHVFHDPNRQYKYATLFYGDFRSDGTITWVSAAHPPPSVFSFEYDRIDIMDPHADNSVPPIGFVKNLPIIYQHKHGAKHHQIEEYAGNKIVLTYNDIFMAYSDGYTELQRKGNTFFPDTVRDILKEAKHEPARTIYTLLIDYMKKFYRKQDDVTLFIAKKV